MPFIEISVTVPAQIINVDKVRQKIIDAQNRKTAPKLIRLFGMTVNGWRNRPDFRSRRIDTANQLGIIVGPSGSDDRVRQYALVNNGASAHIIRPRRARMLRFKPGYRAGTRPHVLSSSAFERSGDYVSSKQVHHPGFEAREFTDTIAREHEPEFRDDMQQAIAEGRK